LDSTKHSILTFHGILLTKDWQIIDEIGFKLKPDDGDYCITAKALQTNQINIAEHDKEAKTYSECGEELLKFFSYYCENGSPFPKRLFAAGQNIQFDRPFAGLFAEKAFEKYMTRGGVDLYSLSLSLNSLGKIRNLKNYQLGTMAKFFGIDFQAHDCKEDIHTTVKCIVKCLELMK
jgi:DNA polymerase III epsilon subunit-like protein